MEDDEHRDQNLPDPSIKEMARNELKRAVHETGLDPIAFTWDGPSIKIHGRTGSITVSFAAFDARSVGAARKHLLDEILDHCELVAGPGPIERRSLCWMTY